jgi:hypothetical protein
VGYSSVDPSIRCAAIGAQQPAAQPGAGTGQKLQKLVASCKRIKTINIGASNTAAEAAGDGADGVFGRHESLYQNADSTSSCAQLSAFWRASKITRGNPTRKHYVIPLIRVLMVNLPDVC